MKKERIQTKPMDISFKVFNIDGTKNREVTRFTLLKVEVNKPQKRIDAAVIDLNRMEIFLEYD